ncbi:MAG: murein biosynthesis integral membrane protein MurJ [Salinibacterium sp.]|nr:MAG: murein biosynthesis integral membrane protein MurJ [Salinibacterium sp.]
MTDAASEARSTIGRASAMLASGTLVSRVLGFISALVLARTIGIVGAGADTFTLANQLPNNIYAIIAGGLLSAVLVPQIVRAGLHGDGGERFINRLVTLGIVVFLVVAALATVGAPFLVNLYAQSGTHGFSSDELALATAFAYWCLPQVLFYALYSLVGEVLNARGVFGPFTWAPAINNVIAIGGLIGFTLLYGSHVAEQPALAWTPSMIALLGGSATLGIAAQAFVLFLFWRKAGLSYRPEFQWRGVGLGGAGRAAAWTFGMILVTQLAGIVQTNVSTLASGEASVAVLRNAWLIFMLPHSIVTVSIGTAYFTRISGHARDGDLDSLRSDVASSLRSILLVMVFAAVGLMVVAFPFSALFASSYPQVQGLAGVLLAFLPGLVPFSILFVLQRVFYALEDTRTPFFIQIVQASVFVAGCLIVAVFPTATIAIGLAVSLTIAGTIQTIVAGLALHRRIGEVGMRPVLRQSGWFALAAVPAAAAGILILLAIGGFGAGAFPVSSFLGGGVSVAVAGIGMLLVYVAVLALARNAELLALAGPLLRRMRARS